jgi:hypothetical protein
MHSSNSPANNNFQGAGGHTLSYGSALYPMYVIHYTTLQTLDKLIPHEEALAQGLLLQVKPSPRGTIGWYLVENMDGSMHGGRTKCTDSFVGASHRWLRPSLDTRFSHPDDEQNSKLKSLQHIFNNRKQVFNTHPDFPAEYLWIDYLCVPQFHRENQTKAIASIPNYFRVIYNFISLVLDAADFEFYMSRGWCGVECVAHRSPAPYQDNSKSVQTLLPNNQIVYFMNNNTQRPLDWNMIKSPLQAQFTIEADRALVAPLVEFYIAELKRYSTLDMQEVWVGRGTFPPSQLPPDYVQMLDNSLTEFKNQQLELKRKELEKELEKEQELTRLVDEPKKAMTASRLEVESHLLDFDPPQYAWWYRWFKCCCCCCV